MSDHISEDLAMILAVLDHDDPERRAALAHAASCRACAQLVERGASALRPIALRGVQADPRLKARILGSVERLENERSRTRWEPYALAFGALLSGLLALFEPRVREGLFPARAPICIAWQVMAALLCLAGAAVWARNWAWRVSQLRLAVVGMAGGLIGQLWLHVRCPTHDALLHVFAFHVTGVAIAAVLGYFLARTSWQPQS